MGIQSSSSISMPPPEKQSTKVDEKEVVTKTDTTTNNDDDDNIVTTRAKTFSYTCAQLQYMYDQYKKSNEYKRDKTPKERIDQFTQYILYTNNRGGKTCNMHIGPTNIEIVTHIVENMQDIFVDAQFVVKSRITTPATFMVTATWENEQTSLRMEPGTICPTDGMIYIDTPGYLGHIELALPFLEPIKR